MGRGSDMMNFNNLDIRQALYKKRIRYYEVAAAMGVSQSTFSRWLQTEMNDKRKKEVMKAIKGIK